MSSRLRVVQRVSSRPEPSYYSAAPGTWPRPHPAFYSPIKGESPAKPLPAIPVEFGSTDSIKEKDALTADQELSPSPRQWGNYTILSNDDSADVQSQKTTIIETLNKTRSVWVSRCSLYHLHLDTNNIFSKPIKHILHEGRESSFWTEVLETEDVYRVQYFSVDNLSQSVMGMLGTKYDIDLDFFYSSVKRIPSQSQDKVLVRGDHIRIVLPFLRMMKVACKSLPDNILNNPTQPEYPLVIDIGEPGVVRVFEPDTLAIYMVRAPSGATAISYHPPSKSEGTSSAENFQKWVYHTGTDVHWPRIFNHSKDPTFIIFPILWWVIYEWNAALYRIYLHIDGLEIDVLGATDVELNKRLHRLRVRLIHYRTFLDDFRKSVDFLIDTPNPHWTPSASHGSTAPKSTGISNQVRTLKNQASQTKGENALADANSEKQDSANTKNNGSGGSQEINKETQMALDASQTAEGENVLADANSAEQDSVSTKDSGSGRSQETDSEETQMASDAHLFRKECDRLIKEIQKLRDGINDRNSRITDVMNLAFNNVTIQENREMKRLTEAAVRDSTAMKQISYLTMVFIPATFVTGVFGMNVKGVGASGSTTTIATFLWTAIPITVATMWILLSFQMDSPGKSRWAQMFWPVLLIVRRGRIVANHDPV